MLVEEEEIFAAEGVAAGDFGRGGGRGEGEDAELELGESVTWRLPERLKERVTINMAFVLRRV